MAEVAPLDHRSHFDQTQTIGQVKQYRPVLEGVKVELFFRQWGTWGHRPYSRHAVYVAPGHLANMHTGP